LRRPLDVRSCKERRKGEGREGKGGDREDRGEDRGDRGDGGIERQGRERGRCGLSLFFFRSFFLRLCN
jgi:hypothetical protein